MWGRGCRSPILTGGDTADDVTDAESVSMAMLVVLETLSPLERAVFVLKEVFDFSHAEIAEAVERSEAAVRQAAHRAREHVRGPRPRFTRTGRGSARSPSGSSPPRPAATSTPSWSCCPRTSRCGPTAAARSARPCVRSWARTTVAAWFAAIGTVTYQGVEPARHDAALVEINGGPGMVFSGAGRVIATVTFDFDADGRITAIHNVANPDKLRPSPTAPPAISLRAEPPAHRQPVLGRSVDAASVRDHVQQEPSAGDGVGRQPDHLGGA